MKAINAVVVMSGTTEEHVLQRAFSVLGHPGSMVTIIFFNPSADQSPAYQGWGDEPHPERLAAEFMSLANAYDLPTARSFVSVVGCDSIEDLRWNIDVRAADWVFVCPEIWQSAARSQYGELMEFVVREKGFTTWLLSENQGEQVDKLAIAMDVPESNDEISLLDRSILNAASTIVSLTEADSVLLHSWRMTGEGFFKAWRRKTDRPVAALEERERVRRQLLIQRSLIYYDLGKAELQLFKGELREKLKDYASSASCTAMIIGTPSRSGLNGWIERNSVDGFIREGKSDIIIVKEPSYLDLAHSQGDQSRFANMGVPQKLSA